MSPLDVMLDNMRHFQQVAIDAEATLEGLTADQFSEQVAPDASPEDQFKFLLAQVKKTAGFRQMAQDAARDAASYVHPKLASLDYKSSDGSMSPKPASFDLATMTDEELEAYRTLSAAADRNRKGD
ncbi:hypothetical protein JVX98_12895 [Ensifer sp. PDNC004]|uniref:hypothetical protein n=1 Tax=Ensifer sp. PDNC004 TaxID=2811423 RepID=UPI0019632205|nr:hypothetical protein [Ensifer sp. PDNC004]QRY69120.1 hypothetical protein JVX98_12895 [Ensifer sp. PDNC004]